MTEPKPPIDALDEQERDLARVLRALPGGEPPAALDQKILRAAANAAASSRRPRSRWLASVSSLWGIGGAAAAVLALGITWQMIDPTRPGSAPRSQAVPAGAAEDSAVTVDLGEARSEFPATTAPAEAPVAAARDSAAPGPRPKAPTARPAPVLPAAAMAAPSPPPPAETTAAAELRDAAPAAEQNVAAAKTTDSLEHDGAAQVAAQQAEKLAADQARERAETSAGLVASRQAAETKAMTPAVWLAKVRKLKAENRLGEARSSLELFHQYYPQYVIPADLAPLLRE